MKQGITIGQLGPSTRGAYLLRFEVAEVKDIADKPDEVLCKVVDDTGCINAYFNTYKKHIKEGQVYDLTGLKCKVEGHCLQLQLLKESKLVRVKHEMGFKDLCNDLSEKFYVSKAEQVVVETKKEVKAEPKVKETVQKEKERSQQQKNQKPKQKQNNKQTNKAEKVKNQQPSQSQQENTAQKPKNKEKVEYQEKEVKASQQHNQTKEKRFKEKPIEKEEEKPAKKKYTEKKQEHVKYQAKEKDVDLQHRVFLKEKNVNLFVQVNLKTSITSSKYILLRACDSSGSTYIEIDKRAHLSNKMWYCLGRFKVFADKEYGYIASQQEYSTLDLLDDYNEVPEAKPIFYPKPR